MARRNYHQSAKGQLYAVEWPEWHVECADDGCGDTAIVAALGMCTTLKEADSIANNGKGEGLGGWKKHGGRWYCPKHNRPNGQKGYDAEL